MCCHSTTANLHTCNADGSRTRGTPNWGSISSVLLSVPSHVRRTDVNTLRVIAKGFNVWNKTNQDNICPGQ